MVLNKVYNFDINGFKASAVLMASDVGAFFFKPTNQMFKINVHTFPYKGCEIHIRDTEIGITIAVTDQGENALRDNLMYAFQVMLSQRGLDYHENV